MWAAVVNARLLYRSSDVERLHSTTRGWAKLATKVAIRAASLLYERRTEDGYLLAEQLRRALAARTQRVPNRVRDAVGTVHAVGLALVELESIVAKKREPSFESAGRALSLRMRWRRICELVGVLGDASLWPGELIRKVPFREGALGDMYERALSQWSPLQVVNAPQGERVEWSDSD